MSIIRHADQPAGKGYYSKIINRKIVGRETGAATCTIWEQVIPSGGYITPHTHDFEETLTFLAGRAEVTLAGKTYQVTATTTVFIRPHLLHSVRNLGDEPVRLLAVLVTAEPNVIYPDGPPAPAVWEDR